jgi:hypothetical protein
MSQNLPDNSNSKEIDIIVIFKLLGDVIKSLFYQIFKLFRYLFEGLIFLSLFIKRNFKKLVIAGTIGFIAGSIADYFEESFYTSTMIVEPNFRSSNQLIESIRLYNQLVISKDSTSLAEIFNISESEANSIKSISITANLNRNTKLKSFNDFVKEADTMTLKSLNFEEYESNLELTDFSQFYITLNAKERGVYKKIEHMFLDIPLADFTKNLQKTEIENLANKERFITSALNKVDSLRNDYKKIMLSETSSNNSKENGSGTNFYLATENKRVTNELNLFELERTYNRMLEDINKEKTIKTNIINNISGFQKIGIKVKQKNLKWFVIGSLALGVLLILLINFNKYLIAFERKRKV